MGYLLYQFNCKLFKQTDGCTMGDPLSVTLSDIHMIQMETDVGVPIRPISHKRYEMIYIIGARNIPVICYMMR